MKRYKIATGLFFVLCSSAVAGWQEGRSAYERGDYSVALREFSALAAAGQTKGQYALGQMYEKGQGVAQDLETAFKWYLRAAKQGHPGAQARVGRMYQSGRGVAQDLREAVSSYREAAEQGNAYALTSLAYLYEWGKGVRQDVAEAFRWYVIAAERGSLYAEKRLGYMYARGRGVAKNYKESARWYRKAAERGDRKAQEKMHTLYLVGLGVEKNEEEALKWGRLALNSYKAAADKGSAKAKFELAETYLSGTWSWLLMKEGFAFLDKAEKPAESESEPGADGGLDLLKLEESFKQNEAARRLLNEAAALGHAGAQYKLGFLYHIEGSGTPRQAAKLYEAAAKQGHLSAQIKLGLMLELGRLGAPDLETAAHWYEMAASSGRDAAEAGLSRIRLTRALGFENTAFWARPVATSLPDDAKAAQHGGTQSRIVMEALRDDVRVLIQDLDGLPVTINVLAAGERLYVPYRKVLVLKVDGPEVPAIRLSVDGQEVSVQPPPFKPAGLLLDPESLLSGRASHIRLETDQGVPEGDSRIQIKALKPSAMDIYDSSYRIAFLDQGLAENERFNVPNGDDMTLELQPGSSIEISVDKKRVLELEPAAGQVMSLRLDADALAHATLREISNDDGSKGLRIFDQADRLIGQTRRPLNPKDFGIIADFVAMNFLIAAKRQQMAGHFRAAESLYKIVLKRWGRRDPGQMLASLLPMADIDIGQRKFKSAQGKLDHVRQILESQDRMVSQEYGQVLLQLANLSLQQGQLSLAKKLNERALTILEGTMELYLKALNAEISTDGSAIPVISKGFLESIKTFRASTVRNLFSIAIKSLGIIYLSEEKFEEAAFLLNRYIALKTEISDDSSFSGAGTLIKLAEILEALDRSDEKQVVLRQAHRDAKADLFAADLPEPFQHPIDLSPIERVFGPSEKLLPAADALGVMADVYTALDRYPEAEPLQIRALSILRNVFGARHFRVADKQRELAGLELETGRQTEALERIRKATDIFAETAGQEVSRIAQIHDPTSGAQAGYLLHLAILNSLTIADQQQQDRIALEGFRVVQLLRVSSAAKALSNMAARFASGEDRLGRLVRTRQDLDQRISLLEERLLFSLKAQAGMRDLDEEDRVRRVLVKSKRDLTALDTKLSREFPSYAELSNPKPLSVPELQALLSESEALVVYAFGRDEGYLWVVRSDQVAMRRVQIGREDLFEAVGILRGQLAPNGVSSFEQLLERGFAGETAHELYRAIFAPAEPLLDGARHVFVVPDSALQSLPLGVLLTDEPQGEFTDFSGYRQAPWLARKYAVTVLPSVSSLGALRRIAKVTRAKMPFTGFGNPVLEGMPGDQRGLQLAGLFRGTTVNVEAVRQLPPLPETADELRQLAKILNAGSSSIYLGAQATEASVRSANLADSRIIAFATHALVGGQIEGAEEPALVLTPPAKGSVEDDGLLTASEIARYLKLDADWVILSACNTAAGDKPGAEGLSGLAKAFFYAGARALLVSHWSVQSEAAVRLTTGMLAEATANPEIGRAEALRRSMLALMDDKDRPYFAHPLFWAPFVVVGEGGVVSGG